MSRVFVIALPSYSTLYDLRQSNIKSVSACVQSGIPALIEWKSVTPAIFSLFLSITTPGSDINSTLSVPLSFAQGDIYVCGIR